MDTTQDITKVDQVSIIIRYDKIDYEKHVLHIKESFIKFYKIDQHESLFAVKKRLIDV
jgi:hypothetical protein